MKDSEEFFVGWNEKLPQISKRNIRKLLISLCIIIFTVISVIVFFTRPFAKSKFELGNIRKLTGVYYADPVPILILDSGQLHETMNLNALLVGYGKNGAKTYLKPIEKKKGNLSGRRIQVQGTLIYGEGKTLIELTQKEQSVISILDSVGRDDKTIQPQTLKLQGEILDPKCWFGVMKPGEGKVHKSCAIRCISGGIPPVLRVLNNGENIYYVLKGDRGQDINQNVLSYIAEPIAIEGKFYRSNGWNMLLIDPKKINLIP